MKAIYHAGYRAMVGEIKKARLRLCMTQAETAGHVGKGSSWISKVERFDLRLDALHLVLLAQAVHLDPGELIQLLER
jgi:transcriptional regulator with XRE-family HTH domain